ncbi:hypothetical protein [Thalassotalea hakodatensis]|uniref:hypothetical protein n=1 Tax=Thalassotalea hakodatensis TaxID=3030492 RepID=UPI00257258DC|nr:hypothetical protein [Thalassotalea hakodatensis]
MTAFEFLSKRPLLVILYIVIILSCLFGAAVYLKPPTVSELKSICEEKSGIKFSYGSFKCEGSPIDEIKLRKTLNDNFEAKLKEEKKQHNKSINKVRAELNTKIDSLSLELKSKKELIEKYVIALSNFKSGRDKLVEKNELLNKQLDHLQFKGDGQLIEFFNWLNEKIKNDKSPEWNEHFVSNSKWDENTCNIQWSIDYKIGGKHKTCSVITPLNQIRQAYKDSEDSSIISIKFSDFQIDTSLHACSKLQNQFNSGSTESRTLVNLIDATSASRAEEVFSNIYDVLPSSCR